MKKFNIPEFYKSPIISRIKELRKVKDPRKKDFSPTLLDFGPVRFLIARHFGFCYGVENAIEISYQALKDNPDKRIFLLSQMIHNPNVNRDLQERGIGFIMDTEGRQFVEWKSLRPDDIVIIPAFGTTLETEEKLAGLGIKTHKYNTTCPFVERVWNRTEQLGEEDFTVIIHGKHNHEETRATFSHSNKKAPSVIVKDFEQAKELASVILGETSREEFYRAFEDRCSADFDPERHLQRIGVVNQTTMLATETQQISKYLKDTMVKKFGAHEIANRFADTRDTLCYATNDNQESTYGLLKHNADLAIVVGGYNSSNTSHLVELIEKEMPTYYISRAGEIISKDEVRHYDHYADKMTNSSPFIPDKERVDIMLTSGASCPDAMVEEVLQHVLGFFDTARSTDDVMGALEVTFASA
jgi:4-hydroxy-3-methylbut-2-enyl diphosphate reductase